MGIATAAVLVVAAIFTAFRVPASRRGHGQPIVLAGVLAIAAFLFSSPFAYYDVDKLLPGVNTLDPITKILLFAAIMVLGHQVASALDDQQLVHRITGGPGRIVFVVSCVALVVLFLLAHVTVRSPMLVASDGQPLVAAYTAVTLAYCSYLSVLLLVGVQRSIGRVIRGTTPAQVSAALLDTRGRLLMILGFGLVPFRLLITPVTFFAPSTYNAAQTLPLATFVLVVVGLALIRTAARRAREAAAPITFAGIVDSPGRDES